MMYIFLVRTSYIFVLHFSVKFASFSSFPSPAPLSSPQTLAGPQRRADVLLAFVPASSQQGPVSPRLPRPLFAPKRARAGTLAYSPRAPAFRPLFPASHRLTPAKREAVLRRRSARPRIYPGRWRRIEVAACFSVRAPPGKGFGREITRGAPSEPTTRPSALTEKLRRVICAYQRGHCQV